jgi:hypothetical protein
MSVVRAAALHCLETLRQRRLRLIEDAITRTLQYRANGWLTRLKVRFLGHVLPEVDVKAEAVKVISNPRYAVQKYGWSDIGMSDLWYGRQRQVAERLAKVPDSDDLMFISVEDAATIWLEVESSCK